MLVPAVLRAAAAVAIVAVSGNHRWATAPRVRATSARACTEADDGEYLAPIDAAALSLEAEQDSYRTASLEELAEYLPDWASEIMLDPTESEAYESSQVSRRAKELHSRRVDGRSWEELEATDAGAGMDEFTPEELAEDYGLPLETICEQMLALGVDAKRLSVSQPVKAVCSKQQLSELLGFLGTTDPIAAREALCDRTLSELAETLPLSADQLVVLCRQNEINPILGTETRIRAEDLTSLLDAADLEIAFGERG